MGHSLHQVHFGPGHAADGPVPVVPDPHVQISGVEVLEILVEGHKVLHVDEDMGQLGWFILTDWNRALWDVPLPGITENLSGKSSPPPHFPTASFPRLNRALRNSEPNLPPQKTT